MNKQVIKTRPRASSDRSNENGTGAGSIGEPSMHGSSGQMGQGSGRNQSSGAGRVKRQVAEVLDRQVASGADMISKVASSTRHAADELEQEVPQLAGKIRSVADTVDGYADGMKGQSVEDVVRSASDFARRQPAIVFGFAALAGFMMFRTMQAASHHDNMSERSHGMSERNDGMSDRNIGGPGAHIS